MSPRKAASRPSPYPTSAAPATPRSSWPLSTRPCPPTSSLPAVSRSSPRPRSPPSSRSSPPISNSPRQRPPQPPVRGRKQPAQPVTPTNGGGRWMQDWSGPPAQANYLAFGYTAAQNGVLVLQGWLYRSGQGYPGQRAAHRQTLSRDGGRSRRAQGGARIRRRHYQLCSAVNLYSARISISPPTVPATKKSG